MMLAGESGGGGGGGGGVHFDTVLLHCGCEGCILSLAGAATSIVFVATKVCLSRRNFCRDKTFVATYTCLSRPKRPRFCRDNHTFDATKDVFDRDKHVFVATSTKHLSRQFFYLWQLPRMTVFKIVTAVIAVLFVLSCLLSPCQ